jgi:hypothetical protein
MIKAEIEAIKSIKNNPDSEMQIRLIGNMEEYRHHFPEIDINPKMKGIILFHNKMILDFTYDTFIESKKMELRHKISKVLFENVK